jgi:hypothetical protein
MAARSVAARGWRAWTRSGEHRHAAPGRRHGASHQRSCGARSCRPPPASTSRPALLAVSCRGSRASVFRDITSSWTLHNAGSRQRAAGRFAPVWRVPARSLVAALVGGLLLGPARAPYGCNIGAFFSGIASSSLHGCGSVCLRRQHRRDQAPPVVRPHLISSCVSTPNSRNFA